MMTRFGFRTQLFAAFSLLLASIAIFFALYFPLRGANAADAALKVRATTVSKVLATLVAASVEFDQARDAESQLASVRNDADLAYIMIIKSDGKVFARFRAIGVSDNVEYILAAKEFETELRGEVLHVRVPLMSGTSQVGTLLAGFSRRSVLTERSRLLWTAILVSLTVLLLGMGVSYVVTRPLVQVSSKLLSAAREQEASMAQGSAEVEETRRTMDLLVNSAQQIADRCSAVLANAESTLSGTRHITEAINELNVHAEKVAELLAMIMQVADRTDLLALNAALEGTRAGEAGRGFTLVAAEMRRLAENVMESVSGIRKLMKDVRSTSQKAVRASHDGTQLSEETTRSAREIALVTQQQRKATEQVRTSMDEMTELLNHTMLNIKQTTREAAALAGLAAGDKLPDLAPLSARARGGKSSSSQYVAVDSEAQRPR